MPVSFLNFATVKDISRQQIGQIMYTPMVNEDGKVAIEGLTLRLAENEYMFSQSGAQSWLPQLHRMTDFDVTLKDVTPDYTCYALQGPRALDILETVQGKLQGPSLLALAPDEKSSTRTYSSPGRA